MRVYVVPGRILLGLNIRVFRAVDFSFVNTNHTFISILGPELSDIIIHKHLNTMETKMVWVPCGAVRAHEARRKVTGLGSGSGLMCRIFTKCSETVSTLTAVVQDSVQTLTPLSRVLGSRPGQKENSLFIPLTSHMETAAHESVSLAGLCGWN